MTIFKMAIRVVQLLIVVLTDYLHNPKSTSSFLVYLYYERLAFRRALIYLLFLLNFVFDMFVSFKWDVTSNSCTQKGYAIGTKYSP